MNYKNLLKKDDSDPDFQQNLFDYERGTSFGDALFKIKESYKDPEKVEKIINLLKRSTMNKNFRYQLDFLNSGFADFLVKSLTLDNVDYLLQFLQLIIQLTSYSLVHQYSFDMCNCGLLESLRNLVEMIPDDYSNFKHQEIITRIVIILYNLSIINEEIKNKIIQIIPLSKIIQYEISEKRPNDDYNSVKYITELFSSLLSKCSKTDETFDVYYPYFRQIYVRCSKSDDKTGVCYRHFKDVMRLFIYLTRTLHFLDYFDKNHFNNLENGYSIVDDIFAVVNERGDDVLIPVLTFSYLVIKRDFSKGEKYVDRYIQLFGSDNIEVAIRAARIVNYIMNEEIGLIPPEKFIYMARHLMRHSANSAFGKKSEILEVLCTIVEYCPLDCVIKMCENGFVQFLIGFLYSEDMSDAFRAVEEINILANKQIEKNGTPILEVFLDEGGLDAFNELINAPDELVSNAVRATVKKYKIKLD